MRALSLLNAKIRDIGLVGLLAGLLILTGLTGQPAGIVWGFGAAHAQSTSMNLGGRRITCSRGKVIVDNKMSAIGLASPARRKMWLNMRRLNRYPRAFRQFVFLHECAHMYVLNETEADCWAIRRGVYRGLFTRASIKQICKALWRTPAGFYHLAGPDRCVEMMKCFDTIAGRRPDRRLRQRARKRALTSRARRRR